MKRSITSTFLRCIFLTRPSCSVPKWKMPMSQQEMLFHEILHRREPLVGSLSFFHFSTEQGNPNWKIPLYEVNIKVRTFFKLHKFNFPRSPHSCCPGTACRCNIWGQNCRLVIIDADDNGADDNNKDNDSFGDGDEKYEWYNALWKLCRCQRAGLLAQWLG